MEFILNAGLGIGVLMFLLLLFKRNKNQGDFLFLGWILITLGQIAFYEITIYQFEISGLWAILAFGLPLLGAPLLFLYIIALTGHQVSLKSLFVHLGIYVLYVFIFFILSKKDSVSLTATNGYFQMQVNPPEWMYYYALPLAISGLVYCIWDLLLLRRHRQTIVDLFSFDERINLKWVTYIVYSYLVLFVLASFLIFGATQFNLFPIESAFALVGIALSLMLIAFGFYGFRQTAIFSNIDNQVISRLEVQKITLDKTAYSRSGLTDEKVQELANQLIVLMETQKPFLNEDFNLGLLAAQSEIPQSNLSQVINQHFKMNFYDFVNRYRVEEVKQKLVSSKFYHLSVLGIAFECGFKSKSSFNRYFKKYTGVSPSDFKKKMAQ